VLFIGLVVYVITGTLWMLTGFGGAEVTHYVGLLSDAPAALASAIVAAATARHSARGALRTGWIWLAVALALYFVGVAIGTISWLRGHDPFPGPADIFFCAFYPALAAAALFLIRAAPYAYPGSNCHWTRRFSSLVSARSSGSCDPPAAAHAEVDLLKQALSLAYLGLDCVLLLALGVLVLTGAGNGRGWRIPLLLLSGFATMFLGDILWSLAKVRGYYLPGGFRTCCTCPATRRWPPPGAHRCVQFVVPARAVSNAPDALARSLPYAAMLAAFLVLGVLRPRRHRRADDRDDHDRVCTHAAVHGPAGCGFARDALLARAPGGSHGRGTIRHR